MDWQLGLLLLALIVLWVGILIVILLLPRIKGFGRGRPASSPPGSAGGTPRLGLWPLFRSRVAQAAANLWNALASLWQRAAALLSSFSRQGAGSAAHGKASSSQTQWGQSTLQRLARSTQAGKTSSSPKKSLSQPAFSRAILLLVVLVMVISLAVYLWRNSIGDLVAGPSPQLTVLVATLPGSAEGQSSAELLTRLQQDLAAVGRPPTLTVQLISDQPADADSAYALALSRQADMLLWGYVRPDLVPGYFLTLTLTPRFHSRLAPEFPEYNSMMVTPAHFPLNRVGNRGLSAREVAQALTWVGLFYTGQFDRLESLPPAEVRGNVSTALFQFHWMALRWLAGDYEGTKQAYVDLGCPVEFVPAERPLAPRQKAERQVCLAAANNRAVTLITQESLGQLPPSSLDGAAATLSSIVAAAPDMTMAWYNLGRAYLARNRWDEAVRALDKAVEQNPRLTAAWAALSEASTEAGNLPRAHEAASRAMSQDRSLVAAELAQGRYLLAIGQPQEAERVLGEALQLAAAETTRRRSREAALREGPRPNPQRADFTAAWARRNDAALVRVHLARARVFLRQAEIEGQPAFLLWAWRLIIGELSPLEKADAEIQLALETHPQWSGVRRAQAQLLIARGSLDDAVVMLRNLQEQDPSDLGIYLDLAAVLRRQWREHRAAGRTTEAQQKLAELRAQYQLLIDRQVDPAQGYFGLGSAAQEIGEWEAARQAYSQAVAVDANYAEAYLRLGQVELHTPNETQALAYLDQALEASAGKGPVAIAAYCERGEILLEQYLRLKAQGGAGSLADAQKAFDAARELDGRAVRALNGRGRIAYEEDNAASAESFYRQAQGVDPRNFDTLYGLGRVYEARGQSNVARDFFFQAVLARPSSIAAHYHLGVAYYALLDKVLARQNLEWVQQKCPALDEQVRPRADDTEACAGVEAWLKRVAGE